MNNLEIITFGPNYSFDYDYDYETLYNLTQSFVDTIRNSDGKNMDRLLLIAGANNQID